MNEVELKAIIKDLLEFIDVPDEPKYVAAIYRSTEDSLRQAADRIVRLKQTVHKARGAIK